MNELLIAIFLIVLVKHFFKRTSKLFNKNELIELIESRQQYRAKARKYL